MVEAVDAPHTLFRAPLTPGVGVQGRNLSKNLSAIKIYSYAKFHPDWSDGLDFYRVRIYIFCALYIRFNFANIVLGIKFSSIWIKSQFWWSTSILRERERANVANFGKSVFRKCNIEPRGLAPVGVNNLIQLENQDFLGPKKSSKNIYILQLKIN